MGVIGMVHKTFGELNLIGNIHQQIFNNVGNEKLTLKTVVEGGKLILLEYDDKNLTTEQKAILEDEIKKHNLAEH